MTHILTLLNLLILQCNVTSINSVTLNENLKQKNTPADKSCCDQGAKKRMSLTEFPVDLHLISTRCLLDSEDVASKNMKGTQNSQHKSSRMVCGEISRQIVNKYEQCISE